jgi:peptidoglycan/LPS O-acetylase OafA/YrhL
MIKPSILAEVTAPSTPPSATTRKFLPYFEGIRGFFAMYVALVHFWYRLTEIRPNLFQYTPFLDHFVAFGHNVIGIFIVISGYVIGLPVARDGQTFRGGLGVFAKRRMLRILPAYYAALAIAIPISFVVLPHYSEGLALKRQLVSIALHLTMLHNFFNGVIETIDSPMWSVAVECDIYILFPFLLVPVARRFGFVAMVVVAFAVGLLPTLVGALRHEGEYYKLSESCFWYLGLFALGYAAANVSVDRRPHMRERFMRWPWGWLALGSALLVMVEVVAAPPRDMLHGSRWLADIFLGLAVAAQFTADARAREQGRSTWCERFFSLRPLLFLGTFSYSFYLVHFPIIDFVASFSRAAWSDAQVAALCAAGLLVSLAVAYIFYVAIERPCMTAYRRRGDAQTLRSTRVAEIPDQVAAASGTTATGD